MKKILVPTDFSPCAENAVNVALEIASKAGAHIVFQHLHDDASGSMHTLQEHERHDARLAYAKSRLDELVHRAGQPGLEATQLLVMNKGNDRIENYIEPLDIDLVVMGSHGATGIRELVMGSQTQRVVRHSKAPVLVIKHLPDTIEFKDVLFATTFHEDPRPALTIPTELCALWRGTIHLLYVGIEKDQQTKAEVEEKMNVLEQQFPNTAFTRNFITTNEPEWGIKHAAADVSPDVIALTTELKTGTFIFSHSLAENLTNHETVPVLVINTNR
jgi:nucleotide-binding universal stress UspA family protein